MKRSKELVRVVVKRRDWLRGTDDGALCRPENDLSTDDGRLHRCCLGFVCNVAGLSDAEIMDLSDFRELNGDALDRIDTLFPLLVGDRGGQEEYLRHTTPGHDDLAAVNDDPKLSDAEREEKLIALGRDNGIDFVFVD